MAVFEYRALTENGAKKKGVLEAENERQARQKLRLMGLVPIELHPTRSTGLKRLSRLRISVKERALLIRQLATLIDAGLPISDALAGVAEQTPKRKIRSLLLAVRAQILEGFSLAAALESYPNVFPILFRASFQAGEESGQLAPVLLELADFSEREQLNQQKIQSALLYPAILTVVAIAIVVFLLGSVMPEIIAVFERQHADLPTITQLLLNISQWVERWGSLVGACILVLFITLKMVRQAENVRLYQDALILKLPIIGSVFSAVYATRYIGTLAMLMKSGVTLLTSMDIASRVLSNTAARAACQLAQKSVKEGGSLSKALSDTGLLPPMMLQIIKSGERSGEMDVMLHKAAYQQSLQSQYLMNNFITVFEPLMLLVMGAVVMMIVTAILLPIMNMNQLLG